MGKIRTAIVGMGVTGRSCIEHLHATDDLLLVDTRPQPPDADGLAAYGETHFGVEQFDFRRVDRIVLSPGISLDSCLVQTARQTGVPLLSDIDLFLASAEAPVFAITGTNGKSTVTSLAGQLMEAMGLTVGVGGNLGAAALSILDSSNQAYALELSSFQLERSSALTLAGATLLNISDDHLDVHGNLEHYTRIKQRIYADAAWCVFNRADPRTVPVEVASHTSFGLDAPQPGHWGRLAQADEFYFAHGDQPLVAVSALQLAGLHNQANLLAACALVSPLLTKRDDCAQIIEYVAREFAGLKHRCQRVASIDGVTYINDSKATNVGAAIASVSGMAATPLTSNDPHVILIAGGDGKAADFTPLSTLEPLLRGLVFIGRDGQLVADALPNTPTQRAQSMADAVAAARTLARPGDSVMLSPACASFDMYANFSARGDAFVAAVKALAG